MRKSFDTLTAPGRNGRRQDGGAERVQAPEELLEILRWHVETQLRTPAQLASDLLFPALHGGFRTRNVFDRPFERWREPFAWKSGSPLVGCAAPSRTCAAQRRLATLTRSISG